MQQYWCSQYHVLFAFLVHIICAWIETRQLFGTSSVWKNLILEDWYSFKLHVTQNNSEKSILQTGNWKILTHGDNWAEKKKEKKRQQKITAFDARTPPGNATIFFAWRNKKINRWRKNPCNDLLLSAVCTENSVWVAFFFIFTPLDFNGFYSQNYFCNCSQLWRYWLKRL